MVNDAELTALGAPSSEERASDLPASLKGFGPPKGVSSVELEELAKRFGRSGKNLTNKLTGPWGLPKELSVQTVQNTWTVEQARGALYAHMGGMFSASAQLWEAILGDDRVIATLGSRVSALFSRPVKFTPANDSPEAKECCEAWKAAWPRISGGDTLRALHRYSIGLGFVPAQIIWDTDRPIWEPHLSKWNPQNTYYDFTSRCFMAVSKEGVFPITPGDGKWFLHAPFGEHRGWIFGSIRGVTEPWMLRHFAFRDMARFSEVHGLPTRVGKVPIVHDPQERANFEVALANLGSDAAMILPKGIDGQNGDGYEYELVEAKDSAWESFPGLIDRCDMAIVLSILFQNLTTQVDGGSYSAAVSHMDVRADGTSDDNSAWKHSIYIQMARPFAYLNFGNADLAPMTEWDLTQSAGAGENAKRLQAFAVAIETLRRAGIKFKTAESLREYAANCLKLDSLPDFDIGEPVAIEQASTTQTGEADRGGPF